MKKTPLYDKHVSLGAKMAEYAGFEMPIQYAGIKEEVHAVRNHCGIFDVSHMGELRVRGTSADAFLDWVLSRPVSGKKPGLISYAVLLYEHGGAVDDLLTYRFAPAGDYWLVVNAANKDKDFAYLKEIVSAFYAKFPGLAQDISIDDESDFYAQIAVQGPEAAQVMEKLLKWYDAAPAVMEQVLNLKNYRSYRELKEDGLSLVISRTGYTGEDGFEIYLPKAHAGAFWDQLIEIGCAPCGLGSRDTLRLEAGMPLYGHEMSEEKNPLEAGVGFVVNVDRDFIAAGKLIQKRKVIPVVSAGRAIPREEYPVKHNGELIGVVTSGTFSPTLGKGIAYIMTDVDFPEDVTEFTIEVHRKDQPFEKAHIPFYK